MAALIAAVCAVPQYSSKDLMVPGRTAVTTARAVSSSRSSTVSITVFVVAMAKIRTDVFIRTSSGILSCAEMMASLGADLPRDINRAVKGRLEGWHLLPRFQIVITFLTMKAAHICTCQSVLVRKLAVQLAITLTLRTGERRNIDLTARSGHQQRTGKLIHGFRRCPSERSASSTSD